MTAGAVVRRTLYDVPYLYNGALLQACTNVADKSVNCQFNGCPLRCKPQTARRNGAMLDLSYSRLALFLFSLMVKLVI